MVDLIVDQIVVNVYEKCENHPSIRRIREPDKISATCLGKITANLENEQSTLANWFCENGMVASPR